jgi:hypothetical protein
MCCNDRSIATVLFFKIIVQQSMHTSSRRVDYFFLERAPPATWKCTAMEEKVEIVE